MFKYIKIQKNKTEESLFFNYLVAIFSRARAKISKIIDKHIPKIGVVLMVKFSIEPMCLKINK